MYAKNLRRTKVFKKGDVVFLVSSKYLHSRTASEENVKIEKVGHIYYTLDNGVKIDKMKLYGQSGTYSFRLYKNKQEYEEIIGGAEMFNKLCQKGYNHNFTKTQMIEVYKILGLEIKEIK